MRENFRMAAYTDLKNWIKQVDSWGELKRIENVAWKFAMAGE